MASSSAALKLFKLSFLLSLFMHSGLGVSWSLDKSEPARQLPPSETCSRRECPVYNVTRAGNGYEIRRYISPVWITTAPIASVSFYGSTYFGFLQLFGYIRGNNSRGQPIKLAVPVITQVKTGSGLNSSFKVSFYLPKINQANPPTAPDLHVQRWAKEKYVAVRRFFGPVNDDNVVQEAAALRASLHSNSVSLTGGRYTVAQYNELSPSNDRVNEIWLDVKVLEERS